MVVLPTFVVLATLPAMLPARSGSGPIGQESPELERMVRTFYFLDAPMTRIGLGDDTFRVPVNLVTITAWSLLAGWIVVRLLIQQRRTSR